MSAERRPARALVLMCLLHAGCEREPAAAAAGVGPGHSPSPSARAAPPPTVNPVVGSSSSAPAVSAKVPGLAPLQGAALGPLEVPGFKPASLALPLGVTQPVPLIVALHGYLSGERPPGTVTAVR